MNKPQDALMLWSTLALAQSRQRWSARGFHELASGCFLTPSMTGELCSIHKAALSEMSDAKK